MSELKYHIYVRVIEIKEIEKRILIWLASKNGIPSEISSGRGRGRDCGGIVINNKSLEVAVKEIDAEVQNILYPGEFSYCVSNPPWEDSTQPYIDKHGLTQIIQKLNCREKETK